MNSSCDTVLFVSAFSYLGGAQISLGTVIKNLDGEFRAVVAAPAEGGLLDQIASAECLAGRITIPGLGRRGTLRARVRIAAILGRWLLRNRRSLVAIHVNGDSELKLILPLVPFIRVPIIVWHHRAQLPETTTNLRRLWRSIARKTVWVAVSEARRAELEQAGVASPANLTVIPNPIDPVDVVPAARHHPSENIVIGYLGCEYVDKGFLLLPAVARQVQDLPVTILCVTKGVPRAANSAAINDAMDQLRGLTGTVSFRPRTFTVRDIYAETDVVIVPSRAESFCRIAAEAMLNGQPVIASDLPALRELVGNGAGMLFTEGDADEAAAAIRTLASDPDLVGQLGQEGRRRAEAFKPDRVVAALERLYRLDIPIDLQDH